MTIRTYDPSRVIITVGAATLSGLADDTFVSIEEVGDGVTSVSGADGEVARAMSSDRRAKITLTLQQTSASNDVLTRLMQTDRISGGFGLFPITIADLRGRTLFTSSEAWVVKMPQAEFGKEVGKREWNVETASSAYFLGGNV